MLLVTRRSCLEASSAAQASHTPVTVLSVDDRPKYELIERELLRDRDSSHKQIAKALTERHKRTFTEAHVKSVASRSRIKRDPKQRDPLHLPTIDVKVMHPRPLNGEVDAEEAAETLQWDIELVAEQQAAWQEFPDLDNEPDDVPVNHPCMITVEADDQRSARVLQALWPTPRPSPTALAATANSLGCEVGDLTPGATLQPSGFGGLELQVVGVYGTAYYGVEEAEVKLALAGEVSTRKNTFSLRAEMLPHPEDPEVWQNPHLDPETGRPIEEELIVKTADWLMGSHWDDCADYECNCERTAHELGIADRFDRFARDVGKEFESADGFGCCLFGGWTENDFGERNRGLWRNSYLVAAVLVAGRSVPDDGSENPFDFFEKYRDFADEFAADTRKKVAAEAALNGWPEEDWWDEDD